MTSAPHRSPATRSGPDPFRHLAVVHRSVEELLETLAPLLRAAVTRGDLIWAAVNDATRDAIERRLDDAGILASLDPLLQRVSLCATRDADKRGQPVE